LVYFLKNIILAKSKNNYKLKMNLFFLFRLTKLVKCVNTLTTITQLNRNSMLQICVGNWTKNSNFLSGRPLLTIYQVHGVFFFIINNTMWRRYFLFSLFIQFWMDEFSVHSVVCDSQCNSNSSSLYFLWCFVFTKMQCIFNFDITYMPYA
jgi:hypothetical protein